MLILIALLGACAGRPNAPSASAHSPLARGDEALQQGDYYHAIGAFTGTISRLSAALKACPETPECTRSTHADINHYLSLAYAGRAYAYLKLGGFEPRVRENALAALEHDPKQADAHLYLGILAIGEGDMRAAQQVYRTLQALDPDYAKRFYQSYHQRWPKIPEVK